MKNATLRGKPDAGNPHVRFDEGEVAPAKPRRGSLLYKYAVLMLSTCCLLVSALGRDLPREAPKPGAPKPFTVGTDVFDPKGGHIQGIAASEDALYIAQMTQLTKVDWTGRLIKKIPVTKHTGDIAWHDGELFTAVAVYPARNEGKIQVFDRDLNLLRETSVNRTLDGIAYLDGVLYVGMGAKRPPSKDPHRVNVLGRFDAKTLKEIAPRADFDYGYETSYAFQNITTDGTKLYGTFYAVKGAPRIAIFDKNLKVLGTLDLSASQGFDILPEKLSGPTRMFIKAKTTATKKPPSVSCAFDFWTPPTDKIKE